MIQSLILHTGSSKTGSSALQTAFVRGRTLMAGQGVWYPESDTDALARTGRPTAGNAGHLVRQLADDHMSDADVERAADIFLSGLAQTQPGARILLSSEWFEGVSADRLSLFANIAFRHASEVKVVYLVRHAADHALALYSDRVWRSGETATFGDYARRYEMPFRAALDRFSGAFGRGSVRTIVYDDHRHNLVGDVLELLGCPVDGFDAGERVNRSLSRLELEIIRNLQNAAAGRDYVARLAAEHAYRTRSDVAEDLMITPAELEAIETRTADDIRYINRTYLILDEKLNSCSDHLRIEERRDAHALSPREHLLVSMLEAALTAHSDLTDRNRPS